MDRKEILAELATLGRLPTDDEAFPDDAALVDRWAYLLGQLSKPISDSEAGFLASCFPVDDSDCYGVAWALVHLIESAQGWPIEDALDRAPSYWRAVLLSTRSKTP